MTNTYREMRWCADIGMYAIDRPIPETCVHATDYCLEHCYNVKLYRLYPAMRGKDERNEAAWQSLDPAVVNATLDRKRKPTERFRLMTRGEAFRDHSDVDRIVALLQAMPNRMVWIPTRAWRDPILRVRLEQEVANIHNVALHASLDPSNTEEEWLDLVSAGWSTMYFGKPGEGWDGPSEGFLCPKTYRKLKGHCGICKAGCFAPNLLSRRVDVLLKEH